jgi:uncharacterized protein
MQIGYPFQIDRRGRVSEATENDHIRHLIEQVLFTIPGERVNRPSFGSGIMQLIFAPNNTELVVAAQFLVQGALEQWLGDVIQIENVDAVATKSQSEADSIQVTVQYVVRRNQQRQVAQFTREV